MTSFALLLQADTPFPPPAELIDYPGTPIRLFPILFWTGIVAVGASAWFTVRRANSSSQDVQLVAGTAGHSTKESVSS